MPMEWWRQDLQNYVPVQKNSAVVSVEGGEEGSCDSQSKSSQYVNLSQANEETLKKEKKG